MFKSITMFLQINSISIRHISTMLLQDHWPDLFRLIGIWILLFIYPHMILYMAMIVQSMIWFGWVVLYTRPSVAPKRQLAITSFLQLPITALVGIVIAAVFYGTSFVADYVPAALSGFELRALALLPIHPLHVGVVLGSFLLFYIFFFLDSAQTYDDVIPCVIRAGTLLLYNIKIYIILFLVWYMLMYLFVESMLYVPSGLLGLIAGLYIVITMLIMVYGNIYVMLVQKQLYRYIR